MSPPAVYRIVRSAAAKAAAKATSYRVARVLHSTIDRSVNWLISPENESRLKLEARYVRRIAEDGRADKVSAYVSSSYGCAMGCKMCELTATGQTNGKAANISAYEYQLRTILDHYRLQMSMQGPATKLNVNFMAQGDALANPSVMHDYPHLYDSLFDIAQQFGFTRASQFSMNVSTIMPTVVRNHRLAVIFRDRPVSLFYSGYTPMEDFRRVWMPNALPYGDAMAKLWYFQQATSQPITLHHCYIAGQNDRDSDVNEMIRYLQHFRGLGLRARFSIVRFNPPTGSKHVETPYAHILDMFHRLTPHLIPVPGMPHKIIPRIGTDVSASCGMFQPLRDPCLRTLREVLPHLVEKF